MRTQVLFVCSKNQWRSPTAEQLFRKHPQLSVRSGGTSRGARRSVTAGDIAWAQVICVMEEKHQTALKQAFTSDMQDKRTVVLDIPDEYQYMDAQLVELLMQSVPAALNLEC